MTKRNQIHSKEIAQGTHTRLPTNPAVPLPFFNEPPPPPLVGDNAINQRQTYPSGSPV